MRKFLLTICSASIALVFSSCFLFEPPYKTAYIEANAVWSESYDEIAIIRSVYESQDTSVPYYGDETARNWMNVVYLADGNLQNRREYYRWTDELGDSSQGSLQSKAVYYRKATRSLYYPLGTYGIIRNMERGQVYQIAIPKDAIRTIFKLNNSPMYEEDGLVPVIETVPSKDGSYVAVVHQVFVLTSLFDGVYITAIGIFTSSGSYIGNVPLTEWNGENIFLRVFHYPLFPENLNSEPPTFQTYRTVPTHVDTLVVWAPEDNGVFYVLNTDHVTNNKKPAIKVSIANNKITTEVLDSLPSVSFTRSAAGGPISDTGELLMVKAYPDDPNRFTIMKYKLK